MLFAPEHLGVAELVVADISGIVLPYHLAVDGKTVAAVLAVSQYLALNAALRLG